MIHGYATPEATAALADKQAPMSLRATLERPDF